MLQDLRYAARALSRHRGLSAVIVLTLALAIGANTAIFSLMDALLLRPLPVRDPQHLLLLQWSARRVPQSGGGASYGDCASDFAVRQPSGCEFSLPFFEELRQQARDLSAVTASGGASEYDLNGFGAARIATAQFVAGNYFSVLGIRSALGRLLTLSDDSPSAPLALVVSYAYWQSAFGGSPAVVGRTIALNNRPVTVIGVAAPRFTSLTPGRVFDGWLPLSAWPRLEPSWRPSQFGAGANWLTLFARLRSGVPLSAAQAEVSGLWRNAMIMGSFATADDAPRVELRSTQTSLQGARARYTQPLAVLMGTVSAILLIACANIAGLLLGRARARQKEFALRRALGASNGHILRQLLAESLLLAACGGVAGLGLAWLAARALLDAMPSASDRPLGLHAGLDARVLLFALGVTLTSGLLFGLTPGLRGTRGNLTCSLKDAAGNTDARRHRWLHLGNGLVVAQIALGMVVLAGAGLLVRTLANLRAVNPGFDTSHVLLFELEPALAGYQDTTVERLYGGLQRRIAALPGVEGVSYASDPLLGGNNYGSWVHLAARPGQPALDANWLSVGPSFLSLMRIPLLQGRDFGLADFAATDSSTPAIVNREFARLLPGAASPIGLHFGAGENGRGWVIVGIAGDTKYEDLRQQIEPTVLVPSRREGHITFYVRTAGDPMALLPAVRQVVRAVDVNLPLAHPSTQAQNIDQLLFRERLLADLSSCFGVLALLLACIGLYGLLAQEVTRRTREIGIRMALGAERGDVLRLVIGLGAALTAIGLAVGWGGAWALTRYLHSLLFGVGAGDPLTLAAVGALLAAVALAACILPARRAARVDPLVALRYE